MQNIGLTSVPALETELELRGFCWYPVSCHDHYTLTQRKGSINLPGSDMTRDPGRRNSERQDESKRAAETVRRAPSKTLDTFEIMLVLVQISHRDLCASRTWEFIKSEKLVSPLDNFPIEVWTHPTWFNPTGQILTPGYGKLKGPNGLQADSRPKFQAPESSQASCPAALRWRGPLRPLFPPWSPRTASLADQVHSATCLPDSCATGLKSNV